MRVKTLTVAALTWLSVGIAAAQAQRARALPPVVEQKPAAAKDDAKATAVANDPAEPPLAVEVSYGNTTGEMIMRGGGIGAVPANRARAADRGQKVDVASSARGTVLTLKTPGAWQGSAKLTFKNGAPPMRFTLKLTQMPGMDLQSLTIGGGSVSLAVGAVSTTETTKYFNAKGQAQEGATGAAYTLTARRRANGDIEVQVARAAGAALGKTLSVGWSGDFGRGKFGVIRGGAAPARVIVDN